MQLPWGINASVTYFYGSGNRFAASIATAPYGKTGHEPSEPRRQRRRRTGDHHPGIACSDRWDGPAVINSGVTIPRNALEGLPLHKVDLHVTKDIRLGGSGRVQLVAEVFNLFNHANYGCLQHVVEPDERGDNGAVRHAGDQNSGTAYVSRQGQLGFKVMF